MRKFVLVVAGVVALSVPVASLAGNPPGAKKLAAQTCKAAHKQMGQAAFKALYHSFAGCLEQGKFQAKQDIVNARQTCKAERSNPTTIPGNTTGKTFNEFYGSNTQAHGKGAGKNAFGKCVSHYARQNAHANASAAAAAAKACKTERASDPATFKEKYGTNTKAKGNGAGKNAFGKCVAQQVKASQA